MVNPNGISDGLRVYLGTTGTGKTYKAIRDLELAHNSHKCMGAIVVDSAGTPTLAHLPLEKRLDSAIRSAWGDLRIVRWMPNDQEEFDKLMLAAQRGGNIRILVDEISFWARSAQLSRACRIWRASNIGIYLTAQNVGSDLGQFLLACNPKLFLFRITAPRSIEWVMRWHGLDPKEVRGLGLGQYLERQF